MTLVVIKTGGKQYVVREGSVLSVEKISDEVKVGDKVTFDEVLLTDNGTTTTMGTPNVKGTKVEAEVIETGRTKKISVNKFKSKSNYFKRGGHRQHFTKVKITSL